LRDAFSGAIYDREGDEMLGPGLYVELAPWNFNLFQCGRLQSAMGLEEIEPKRASKGAVIAMKESVGQQQVA
jgi:hypothetical protein